MLNATDQETFRSIRELRRVIEEGAKPLILWVGAGSSKWLGYPLWKELARSMRSEFRKFSIGFDDQQALQLIHENAFPAFFQQCRELDPPRYHRFLSNAFLPVPDTPLYDRFIASLGKTAPLHILTTNVDEALEQRFPGAAVYQRSNFGACIEQLQSGKPFIAKLHGTRSAIETAVFTSADYQQLKSDTAYISALKNIFALGSVIFFAYSLADRYLIDVLTDDARDASLFGPGPHFIVTPEARKIASVRQISYSIDRYADHRAALTVLDIISQAAPKRFEVSVEVAARVDEVDEKAEPPEDKTGYFISDILPPGSWNTSITAQMIKKDGLEAEMSVGLGFVKEELLFTDSTALHDLIVGLICFDFVCFPLSALAKVHVLLGPELFWKLAQNEVIRFVYLRHEPAVIFPKDGLLGDIGLVELKDPTGETMSIGTYIRRHLNSIDSRGEELLFDLESKTTAFDEAGKIDMAGLVRASFMMPDVARLLGIGDAILPTQVPSWLRFPCLRMAHLVHTGAVCDHLGLQAAKIPFGGLRLTSAAFGIQQATESADQYASYVLSGRFNTDLGPAVMGQPSIIQNILQFRNTGEGESFRKEVRHQLLLGEANEFSAAVNAGLKRNIPITILERARDKLSSLLTEKTTVSPVPAVWTNSPNSDDSTRLWRAKSRSILMDLAKSRGVRGDDECICGSGDKLRLCCKLPLEN